MSISTRLAIHKTLLLAIGSALLITGVAKLIAPAETESILGSNFARLVAVAELVLAGLLATRMRVLSLYATTVLSFGGLLVAWWGEGGNCGCLGKYVQMTRLQHVIMASAIGMFAVLALGTRVAVAAASSTSE